MKTRKDIAQRLKKVKEMLDPDGSVSHYAVEVLRITRAVLYSIYNGTSPISEELQKRLLELGVNYDWIITGEGEPLKRQSGVSDSHLPYNSEKKAILSPGLKFVDFHHIDTKIPVLFMNVPAGIPTIGDNHVESYVDLKKLFHKKTFLIDVSGDSMTGIGIQDGDRLLIDRERRPKAGDIVFANVDGALTVKTLKFINGHAELVAENDSYQNIIVIETLNIIGVVTMRMQRF